MSNHLREDNECQNCGRIVEEVYCPRCGQKNTETRQSFGHLVAHFAEDLTHYDGAFWKTIKYLLFRPAFLTKEYLQGKRQAYVPPVKLYIFISFITFFIPAVVPSPSAGESSESATEKLENEFKEPEVSLEEKMTTKASVFIRVIQFTNGEPHIKNPLYYSSIEEMDSIEQIKPSHLRLSEFRHKLAEKVIHLYSKKSPRDVGEQFAYSFYNSIPKTIFFYLPIFAFWLWLMHGKKRWLFFDHGIFTLHYFSFLLINIAFLILLSKFFKFFDSDIASIIFFTVLCTSLVWQVYYFYRAHRKMYYENWFVSFAKSTFLFFINLLCIVILLIILTYITFYTLH